MKDETGGTGAGGLVVAFLAGVVTGTVAALLLAPRSGSETRARLGDAVGRTGARARRGREAARAAVAAAEEAFAEAMKQGAAPGEAAAGSDLRTASGPRRPSP
jgi:gas vesicle protein